MADSERILGIYQYYVENTVITFECDTPSITAFQERIQAISSDYPYLVCTLDNVVIGFAYAHRQKERAAYKWNAELSIYLEKSHFGLGIGKALYSSLLEILKIQNVQNVYGVVAAPNPNSERLHKRLGFAECGTYHQSGFKFNKWHDVLLYEKIIGAHEIEPKPFLPIREINPNKIDEILARCSAMIKNR